MPSTEAPSVGKGIRQRVSFVDVILPVTAAVLGTFLFHRFSLLTGLDLVQADTGDSRFIAFLLEHWNNVLHGAGHWHSPPIFWPARGTLAYSDGLAGMAAIHVALRTRLGVFTAINLQLVLLTLATFASTFWLLRRGFGQTTWGATAGAWFFAYSWPRFAQLGHLQLQFTPLVPLAVLLALECGRGGLGLSRPAFACRATMLAAVIVGLLATVVYYAIFLALALCVAGLLCAGYGPARRHLARVARRQWPGLLGAAVAGAVMVAPVVLFYMPVIRASGGRDWEGVSRQLPDLCHLFWTGQENWVWGWWFARLPEQVLLDNWPDFRIGVGLIASVTWCAGIVWAGCVLVRRRHLAETKGLVPLAVLTGAALQLLMLSWPGGHSAWWVVWRYFPGAQGLRSVQRLELLVTLAMAVWFGALVDRAMRRPALAAVTAVLFAAGAAEQIGGTESYSGRHAEALSRWVGEALPPSCRASYIIAPPNEMPSAPEVDEEHFDAAAYLAANPDVAAAWHGPAWEHYRQFGRAEHRLLNPAAARYRLISLFHAYNYTIPLAAVLVRRPVVNGLSGWEPPGWNLFDVFDPEARDKLAAWLQREGQAADAACVVPVRITVDMVPYKASALWPSFDQAPR